MSERTPVAPYMAVGLSTIVHGVAERRHIQRNLDIIEDAIHAAVSIIGINMPVKLIALAEGALTGFTDEIFDIPHVTAARELFIDIPGEESERLAELARLYETYIVVQCKARWPEVMPDRFFNTLFVISPQGEIVHKRGQEPPLVPRALVHAARRLRPLGRALRRRHRRVLPRAAHRRHRQPRDDLLLGRRVPGGRARARVRRRRGRLPAERGRADDAGRRARRHVAAAEPRARALQQPLRRRARTSGPSTCTRAWSTRTTSAAATRTSSTTRAP